MVLLSNPTQMYPKLILIQVLVSTATCYGPDSPGNESR